MASFNKVILMGNLTRDVNLKTTSSQMSIADFGIACNRKFKTSSGEQRDEVTFVDITAFGKTAEVINQYFTKGTPILIEGRLRYESWDDKNGGVKRHKLSVIVETFSFVGGKRDAGNAGGSDGDSASDQQDQSADFQAADTPF